jgi:hypothetical protein
MKKKSIAKLKLKKTTLQTLDPSKAVGGYVDDSTPYTGPGGPGGTNIECTQYCTNTCYTKCNNLTCGCTEGFFCNITGQVLSQFGVTCRQGN